MHHAEGDAHKAIELYQESARVLEQAGERKYLLATLFQLGVAYYTAAYHTPARFAQAREVFERTLTLATEFRDAQREAQTLYYLGLVAGFEDNSKQALDYLERSRRVAAANGLSLIESEALVEEGGVRRQRGDFRQALTVTVRGIELLRSRKLEKKLPHALIRLGILYADQGDFAKAVATLNEGLETARRTANEFDAAFALLNLAAVNKEAGDLRAARKYYTESLRVAEAEGIKSLTATALGGLGGLQQLEGDYAEAEQTLRKGLAVADESGAKLRSAVITWHLADLSLAQEQPARAAELASRAAALAAEIEFTALVSLALTTDGRARIALGDQRRAEGLLKQAVELIEQLRSHVAGGATEYQTFFDRQITPHHLLVQLLLSQNRREEALLFAERAKGRALLDALRAERRDEFDGLTERQRADEADLRRRIIALNLRLSTTEPRDSATLERLRRELQDARLRYESFRLSIAAGATGDRAQVAAGGGLKSTSELAPLLNDGRTALLEYVLTGDTVTLFVVTRRNAAGATAPVTISTHQLAVKGEELARVAAGFREDGLLEAWEIADLRLVSDLVILSACDTARGKISHGEGVIGIAWAFQLAGCPTVIVSRWPVDSAGTAELMIGFHRELNGRRTAAAKSEVWREAARRLIADARYKHPFYWAGFSLVGAGN